MAENQSPHYHVFLSHNSRDKGSVEPLAVMLKEKGLNPFLDKWNLVPGEPIEDALIEALENSDSAVIFVGPGGEGPWQSEEMRDILKRAVKSHNEFRAIPVLLPNASAEALEKSFLGSRLWIEFKDVDDGDALLRLAKAIQGEASGDESFKLPDEPAPYRGLERFERIEKPEEDFFFGRDDEIRALVERLVKQRFVAVVGASGSGKSSLIRAGLTKQLAEEIHPGIRRWQTITVEPGRAPFRSLAVQVAVAAGIPVADREDWIEKSVEKWTGAPDGVRLSLDTLFADAKEPLLVFIDQFEEIFTHRREGQESETISRNFVANLADIWQHGGDRVRVMMALRADFVERCLEIGPLKELLQDHTMLVGEVGDDALREIVKEPAARVGAFLEKGLMERILNEVRNQSGSLPLLQQALHGLWRNRKGAWLTHEAYDASGGVARALNDQAQGAYKSLNDAQKKIADSLFPRLITLGEGVADTRRRVKRKELYPEGVEPDVVNAVIDTLSGKDARILVTTREGGTAEDLSSGEDFVEFTHEALLGNWDHLVSLLDSERESIRKHRNLTTAAEEWESKPENEKEKFLLRAGQLVIAEQWATDEGGYARLNQLERRFLDESIQERTAEEARKARTARRLKWLSTGATVAAVVAIVFVVYAFQQKKEAVKAQDAALEEKAKAEVERAKAVKAQTRAEALLVSGYLKAIGNDTGDLTSQEVDSFWDIALIEEDALWVMFVEHALSTDKFARQVLNRMDYVAHALVGLSLKKSVSLLDIALRYLRNPKASPNAKVAVAQLSTRFVGEKRIEEVAQALVEAMMAETDLGNLSSLGKALGGLGARLPGQAAATIAQTLVDAMKDEKDLRKLSSLNETFRSIGARLPEQTAATIAQMFVDAMKDEKDLRKLSHLNEAFRSISARLPEQAAATIAQTLVDTMKTEKDKYKIRDLDKALRSLGARLPEQAAATIAQALVDAMQSEKDWEQLSELGKRFVDAMKTEPDRYKIGYIGGALRSLGARLPEQAAATIAQALVDAMQSEKDWEQLSELSKALGSVVARQTGEAAATIAQSLVDAMKNEPDRVKLSYLGEALGSLGARLPGEAAAAGAQTLVDAMQDEKNTNPFSSLGEALSSLGARLPRQAAATIAQTLVDAMQDEKDLRRLSSLSEALRSLGARLPGEAAAAGAQTLVDAMQDEKNLYRLWPLSETLRSLFAWLPEQAAATIAQTLVIAMQDEKRWERFLVLGKALGSLGAWLPGQAAAAIAQTLVDTMQDEKDLKRLSFLGKVLGSLDARLPEQAAATIAQTLVIAMQDEKRWERFLVLGKALGSLGAWLPGQAAAAIAQTLVDTMQDEKDLKRLSFLGKVLGSMDARLPGQVAAAIAQTLVDTMQDEKDWRTLWSLGKALRSLDERLSGQVTAAGAQALVAAMQSEKNSQNFSSSLSEALGSLGVRPPGPGEAAVDAAVIKHALINILKHPLCIGKARSAVLKALEKNTGMLFHDPDSYGLRLVTTESTTSIPSTGKRLVIVAKVKDQLHFRIFNAEGKQVEKQREKDVRRSGYTSIPPDAKLERLKRQLYDFWEPAVIPQDTKAKIVESVTSLLGHTLEYEYDIWKLVEQAGNLGLDVTTPLKRPGDTT